MNGDKKANPPPFSARSISIYSHGEQRKIAQQDGEWKYRVNNRDHLPDFFPKIKDTIDIVKDKQLRFSTPKKFTYHLPKEEQHHDIEITFIQDLIKQDSRIKEESKVSDVKLSVEQKKQVMEDHLMNKEPEEPMDEDVLFGTDSEDSFT